MPRNWPRPNQESGPSPPAELLAPPIHFPLTRMKASTLGQAESAWRRLLLGVGPPQQQTRPVGVWKVRRREPRECEAVADRYAERKATGASKQGTPSTASKRDARGCPNPQKRRGFVLAPSPTRHEIHTPPTSIKPKIAVAVQGVGGSRRLSVCDPFESTSRTDGGLAWLPARKVTPPQERAQKRVRRPSDGCCFFGPPPRVSTRRGYG